MRFLKPILSASEKLNSRNLVFRYNHCNGYSRIFQENSKSNQVFDFETVVATTVSTNYNHYNSENTVKAKGEPYEMLQMWK